MAEGSPSAAETRLRRQLADERAHSRFLRREWERAELEARLLAQLLMAETINRFEDQ